MVEIFAKLLRSGFAAWLGFCLMAGPAHAGPLRNMLKSPASSTQGLYAQGKGTSTREQLGARSLIFYQPASANHGVGRPLLVVLHGGLGNAEQIQKYIGLEPYADAYDFNIAYLDGTKVARLLSSRREGWNAGDCCGQPQEARVDDVGFINAAVRMLVEKYRVDAQRVYGVGHSNGAMMTYRMLCESNVYAGAALYSGTLEISVQSCPLARGKHILAIHGAKDENVPLEGGYTRAGVNRKTKYTTQAYTAGVFQNSGADYTHLVLPNAEHRPETINADLLATEGVTLPQKIVTFLGVAQ